MARPKGSTVLFEQLVSSGSDEVRTRPSWDYRGRRLVGAHGDGRAEYPLKGNRQTAEELRVAAQADAARNRSVRQTVGTEATSPNSSSWSPSTGSR